MSYATQDLSEPSSEPLWFSPSLDVSSLGPTGVRPVGGGMHQTKTMMLTELETLLGATTDLSTATLSRLVVDQNLLEKRSASSRQLTLERLTSLYGFKKPSPVSEAFLLLWRAPNQHHPDPILPLLAALARDPVLRASAGPVLSALPGEAFSYPRISEVLERVYQGRWSEKMLRSAAQNCASSWTQAGHLAGRTKKVRQRAQPSPSAAAYAVFLAHICGFTGAALLDSGWLRVLDRSQDERIELLRRAASTGFIRVRAVGDVFEADPAGELGELAGEAARQRVDGRAQR